MALSKLLCLLIFCVSFAFFSWSEQDLPLSKEELAKLGIRDLKKILTDRDETCKGCTEKKDFVEKAFEIQNKPVKKYEQKKSNQKTQRKQSGEDVNTDDIMELLKKSGFNGKMYTRKDFEKFDKEFGKASDDNVESNDDRIEL